MNKSKITTYQLTTTAVFTALMCVLGPFTIPLGPIPISLVNFIIFLSVYILGTRFATMSVVIYILIGIVGLPVFSGGGAGLAKVVGPTGGFLVGYIFLALIQGILTYKGNNKRTFYILGMILGMVACYAFGTAWFVFVQETTVWYSLSVCVFPFLIGDGIKIVGAAFVGPTMKKRLHFLEV